MTNYYSDISPWLTNEENEDSLGITFKNIGFPKNLSFSQNNSCKPKKLHLLLNENSEQIKQNQYIQENESFSKYFYHIQTNFLEKIKFYIKSKDPNSKSIDYNRNNLITPKNKNVIEKNNLQQIEGFPQKSTYINFENKIKIEYKIKRSFFFIQLINYKRN